MSTREDVIKKIEIMPEETLKKVLAFIGTCNKEAQKPLSVDELTEEQFNAEIQKGMDSINAGRIIPVEKVRERMQGRYES